MWNLPPIKPCVISKGLESIQSCDLWTNNASAVVILPTCRLDITLTFDLYVKFFPSACTAEWTISVFSVAGPYLGNIISFPLSALLCQYGFDGGWPSVFYVFGKLPTNFVIPPCSLILGSTPFLLCEKRKTHRECLVEYKWQNLISCFQFCNSWAIYI